MKLRELTILSSLLAAPAAAHAGGLFLPGSGAISTSRAGAAIASTDDGEALGINPAGLAKTKAATRKAPLRSPRPIRRFRRASSSAPVGTMAAMGAAPSAAASGGAGGRSEIVTFALTPDLPLTFIVSSTIVASGGDGAGTPLVSRRGRWRTIG